MQAIVGSAMFIGVGYVILHISHGGIGFFVGWAFVVLGSLGILGALAEAFGVQSTRQPAVEGGWRVDPYKTVLCPSCGTWRQNDPGSCTKCGESGHLVFRARVLKWRGGWSDSTFFELENGFLAEPSNFLRFHDFGGFVSADDLRPGQRVWVLADPTLYREFDGRTVWSAPAWRRA